MVESEWILPETIVIECRRMSFKYRIPDYPLSFLIFLFIIFGGAGLALSCGVVPKSNFRQCHVWMILFGNCIHSHRAVATWLINIRNRFTESRPKTDSAHSIAFTLRTERVHLERKNAWRKKKMNHDLRLARAYVSVVVIFCFGCNISWKQESTSSPPSTFESLESKYGATDNVFYWKFIVFWQQQWNGTLHAPTSHMRK